MSREYICMACGTQYPPAEAPPEVCPVCEDNRQFVPPEGQRWTTMDELREGHENRIEPLEPALFGIGTEPTFAIGQRALLIQTQEGNVLWDCVPLLDDDTVRRVRALGGIDHIAISHPHYYSSMVQWARAFEATVHLHAADREWILYPDPRIRTWEGERMPLLDGVTLHRLGGHFAGGQVLLWRDGAGRRGALLTGDIVQVVPDRGWVSFMYSFPNHIPLPAAEVRRIGYRLADLPYERIYGAWWGRVIDEGGPEAVERSVDRYLQALGAVPATTRR